MYFKLETELQSCFSQDGNLFDHMMSLRGKIYRQVAGRCTQEIILNGKKYFIKQHTGIGWKEIFKNLFQGRLPIGGAEHEWQALTHLKKSGIEVPEVVGYGSRGKNIAYRQSFIVTKALPEHISLEDYCREWAVHPPLFSWKKRIIKELARIARIMHQQGINHRDFYLCHFLLDVKENEAGHIKLYLIDLHRAGIRSFVPTRWRIKDLAGLYFSSKTLGLTVRDYFRFIKAYRQQPLKEIIHSEWTFWQKVKERGETLYRKHEK